jgi:uncharacterized protein (DUF1810 family)
MTKCPEVDPWRLQRFVDGQVTLYPVALHELRDGRAASHWLWCIFPTLAARGFSGMSRRYGLSGPDEEQAFLAHTVLGSRLRECAWALEDVDSKRSALDVFGYTDASRLHSSLTLFRTVAEEGSVFERLLRRYFDGRDEERTARLLRCAEVSVHQGDRPGK